MNTVRNVYLCDLDGGAFEDFCHELLQKCYVADIENVPLVGDGGKDLIVRFSPTDVLYVECKHHQKPIGRPEVQKLHSAMMTDGVKRGMIISTGGFSDAATKHIQENRLNIETMDFYELKSLGANHGFKIMLNPTSDNVVMCTLAPYDMNEITGIVSKHTGIRNSGKTAVDPGLKIIKNSRVEKYAFCFHVSASEDFKMTNGTLLHSLDKKFKILFDENMREIQNASNIMIKTSDGDRIEWPIPSNIDIKKFGSDIKESMIKQFTKTVSYVGGNGSSYQKTCCPKAKNVTVSFEYMLKYYVADVIFEAFGLQSRISFIENKNDTPMILYRDIKTDGMTQCDDCKTLVEKTHTCSLCGKFVCGKCALQYKKGFLSGWKNTCTDCSEQFGQKVKIRKHK